MPVVHPDPRDLTALGSMLAFSAEHRRARLPALANIGIIDDGSAETGEVLNLLARRNLFFRVVQASDPALDLKRAHRSPDTRRPRRPIQRRLPPGVRQKLTDEKRLVRVYGSTWCSAVWKVMSVRFGFTLINYGGGKVEGLRVRVRGPYPTVRSPRSDYPNVKVADYGASEGRDRVHHPEMDVYAVVDLKK